MTDYTNLYDATKRLASWLDENSLKTREEHGLRCMKVCEEAGEVAQAWIGFIGQNPRKGASHTLREVVKELGDVVFAALVALESITGNSRAIVETRARETIQRVNLNAGWRKDEDSA